LQDAKLEAFTAKSIVDPGQLRREIEEVRRGGVAIDDGEFSPEARCVAMAVRNFTGQVAGAIGISAPAWRLSIQSLRERTEQVCRAAERLSADLGYRGDVGEAAPARDTAGRKK
jgi:DNA-binding IclR family transcriptional regulator